jgi:hypothetical protein
MHAIPECPLCGAPALDRWCAACHDRMAAAYADAEAERLAAEDAVDTAPSTDLW